MKIKKQRLFQEIIPFLGMGKKSLQISLLKSMENGYEYIAAYTVTMVLVMSGVKNTEK